MEVVFYKNGEQATDGELGDMWQKKKKKKKKKKREKKKKKKKKKYSSFIISKKNEVGLDCVHVNPKKNPHSSSFLQHFPPL
ncbi:hypothetical protein HanIR_Chr08g0351251 [Helianthus annuus]|nr:hypothetical protein HanIR_Chr08g0351251 [Helianthus annuus]